MIAGVIGATGYSGAEIVRFLAGHPKVTEIIPSSVSFTGDNIEKIFPNFIVPEKMQRLKGSQGKIHSKLEKPDDVIAQSDIIFAALPAGVGDPYAKACLDKGISYIDMSADFRFGEDGATYEAWYGKPYGIPELRKQSVYGLPELNRAKIKEMAAKGPVIIGNPGCYPTGASLGSYPALAKKLFAGGTIIVDSDSGVTGGGRDPKPAYHFPECSDSVSPYKVGNHRHTPEISRNMAQMADQGKSPAPKLIFTPHLAPMNRGILSNIYIPLTETWQAKPTAANAPRPPSKEIKAKEAEIRALYTDFYKDEPFVRVLPEGIIAATGRVRESNFCDISVHMDQSGSSLIIISALDNMVKGAAGQAVQNMNIIMGYDETAGLGVMPALF
jgi:N-acetyl-gamma-glutamyl-phosphate reductase